MISKRIRGKTSAKTVLAARDLRRKLTLTEQVLWEALRDGRLDGLKFRRQHPFGPYIMDFFCVKAQLAVEIDGGVHDTLEQKQYDRERTAYLEVHGLQVLRFRNEDVENKLAQVLEKILESTSPTPQPPPSPDLMSGEGGGAKGGGG